MISCGKARISYDHLFPKIRILLFGCLDLMSPNNLFIRILGLVINLLCRVVNKGLSQP
jgi:hypothetical protein